MCHGELMSSHSARATACVTRCVRRITSADRARVRCARRAQRAPRALIGRRSARRTRYVAYVSRFVAPQLPPISAQRARAVCTRRVLCVCHATVPCYPHCQQIASVYPQCHSVRFRCSNLFVRPERASEYWLGKWRL